MKKKIRSALISVFHKEGIDAIVEKLKEQGVKFYSTGGTQAYLESLGAEVISVESLTGYPSIMGGRVKTLHPSVFGGILARRDNMEDVNDMAGHQIPEIDLVIVDLYPFEATLAAGAEHDEIIEKIDIGGISLIRAAAKNYKEVCVVPSADYYGYLYHEVLVGNDGWTTEEQRRYLSGESFTLTRDYDNSIGVYLRDERKMLRYGENPHQEAWFQGRLKDIFEFISLGKELSYNNLLDIDAAVDLISDFEENTFAVLKHNNACGLASREKTIDAWKAALAGDPVSAFGGILITNGTVDSETAKEINELFYEVLIAKEFEPEALEILKAKKKRIVLRMIGPPDKRWSMRTALNGVLHQETDIQKEKAEDLKVSTKATAGKRDIEDLLFANKIVKHTKSNTIVLAKGKQLIGSGTGQTSRIDALRQAIDKAANFGFDTTGAVMASDAFFPFPDCVELANKHGIKMVVQPGGSIRDKDSIEYCDANGICMCLTGFRHFKH